MVPFVAQHKAHRNPRDFHHVSITEGMFSLNRPAIDQNPFPAFRLADHIRLSPAADHRSGFRGKPPREGDNGIILRADQ